MKFIEPSLYVKVLNLNVHTFHFFGILGCILGFSLGLILSSLLNLSMSVILLLGVLCVLTFFVLAFSAKILTGKEDIVYYHHEVAVLLACTIILKLLGLPVLNYIDITLLSISVFLVFGRIGCYSVGCCHGIPAKKKGVVYGEEHKKAGFTKHLVNIPLLPVQLIESAFAFILTLLGIVILLNEYRSGTFLILYTILYGSFRFTIEFFRGDPERPYWKGFSEAQWTTLFLFLVSIILSLIGWLPFYALHFGAVIGMIILMGGIIWKRSTKKNQSYKIKNPHHISDLMKGLNKLELISSDEFKKEMPTHITSLGLKISSGKIYSNNQLISHYSLSTHNNANENRQNISLNLKTAQVVGEIIKEIKHPNEAFKIQSERPNVYHIIFQK